MVHSSIPGPPTRRLLPGSTILSGSPDSRFRVPSSPQGSWRPIGIAGISSLDFTVGLILVMSGRRASAGCRGPCAWGPPEGEDCRIPRHTLTAISGGSPQGGFRHLPLKNRSLAVFWRTLSSVRQKMIRGTSNIYVSKPSKSGARRSRFNACWKLTGQPSPITEIPGSGTRSISQW